jgi:uncharacterized protein involved in exopolysaccharide biosynthesis
MTSRDDQDPKDDKGAAPAGPTPLELLAFAARAARRHVRLGSLIAVSTIALGLAVSKVIPQTYEANSRILADETFNKTEALSTPDRVLPNLDPFSGSFELLTQKSVLTSIVDEAGLVTRAEPQRLPWLRSITELLGRANEGEPSLDEKRDAMAKRLAAHINLRKNKNVVTIQVTWPDARKALQIAQVTYAKFIELLRNRDTATFSAAISILEDEAKRASEAIEPALTEVVRERDQNKLAEAAPAASAETAASQKPIINRAVAAPTPSPSNDAAAMQAKQFSAKLAEINGKIQSEEDAWHRRQSALNERLTELRTVYGQEHPQILRQQALIKAASQTPAELTALHSSRTELLSELQSISRDVSPTVPNQPRATWRGAARGQGAPTGVTSKPTPGAAGPDENLEITAPKSKLIRAIDSYNNVSARLASARLQMVASQATFGLRFVIVNKPELSHVPLKPLRMLVRYAAIAAGLLFGFLAGAIRDLLSGRIYESSQLKSFGLKDLGELVLLEPSER